jgi:uncharacterized membrane protein YsdA (DUF1294 family)/cold shock CspA family protein
MRYQRKITSWKDDRGFGFITPNGGGSQVFVHINSFTNRQRRPVDNETVTYDLKISAKGRAQAEKVAFEDDRIRLVGSPQRGNFSLLLATAFLFFVAWSTLSGTLPLAMLGIYLAASAVTFIAYALDKTAAKNDQWRTQESTLHLLALAGGWPGALAAQRLLRHKSKKLSFRIQLWITILLNCSLLGWLFTAAGAKMLRSLLEAAR